tara:strand:+ start:7860 stop:9305 length:1446 start_codon:yes stop_codon:yes gene_type:complete
MVNIPVVPVILCGGSGTRLWPLSRESYPKQFLNLDSEDKKSLLQKTQERILNLDNAIDPILICNEDHRFIVAEQMREINQNSNSIILEPIGKNTAPAIALGALKAIDINKDAIILVLSSDHLIKDNEKFIKVLNKGLTYAKNNFLVTFGVVPTSPEIGYGYIKAEKAFMDDEVIGNKIEEFTEKPNFEKANIFIKDKRYLWNSGIFIFKAQTIIKELEKYEPEIVQSCKQAINKSTRDLDFTRINEEAFKKSPSMPIDIAVMEKTDKGLVLPLDAGWSDIGSWKAVWETSNKDKKGNFIQGKVITNSVENCYLRGERRLIVGIGISDLAVIETNDAILISKIDDTQKVKDIVNQLKSKNIPEGQKHKKIYRPWGHYLSLVEESRWQVKLIMVKPGEKLSLQLHHHRSEHWVVVNGTAKVELDNNISILSENESVYIPLRGKHRLSNPGKINLILIEVQSGSYVGEDDIVRFDDKYGRNVKN